MCRTNNNMRNIGIQNTKNFKVNWVEGTGENTNMKDTLSIMLLDLHLMYLIKKNIKRDKRILKE